MKPIKEELASLLSAALTKAGATPSSPIETSFEIPREEKFGDLSTHAVLKLAKEKKTAPRKLADDALAHMNEALKGTPLGERVSKIAVEGPGFINFYYANAELARVLPKIKSEGADYGRPKTAKKKILLEFVSANPTGPLTVAHGRQAALGDSLARILSFCGHDVTREYYNNDEGVQITTLGQSTWFRVREILLGPQGEIPENYYRGDYLIGIAKDLIAQKGEAFFKDIKVSEDEKITACRLYARDTIMAGIKKDLIEFDVRFDNYYSQEALGKSGKVESALEELKKRGVVFEKDGAVWLRSTDYGDDLDRVLIKSDKNYTYLTPDIAYHHEKYGRGFGEIINILGPDHHGYIARLKASQTALGHDPDKLHVLIAQLVTLYEGGEQVRMSTRAGEFITLRQILDEVGRDAGRFFFLMRKFDTHLDFDLALAKTQTPDNPVFYIQYAHARVESVKRNFDEKGLKIDWSDTACLAKLDSPLEVQTLRLLSQFEDNLLGAEKTLEPFRLVPYLRELAAAFHRFYAESRVVTDDESLSRARMMMAISVQSVLRIGLGLLGVSAPEKM
jgi:arginyl-tRNA synthetase